MRIVNIHLRLLEYPLETPFYPAWLPGYPQTAHRVHLLTLETDEGIKGYAAGVAFMRAGSGLQQLLMPFLFGRDPMQVEEVVQIARSATFLGLRLWWIEMAFWDIIGKAVGQPVYRLLGGYQERVKAYASTGELRAAARCRTLRWDFDRQENRGDGGSVRQAVSAAHLDERTGTRREPAADGRVP
ncbi:MAG: hypothetical protein ACK4ME_07450 [Fimbriimonadales bacterium]